MSETPLERSYRRLLRVLPTGYRQRWGEDMLATLVQSEQQMAAESVAVEGIQRQAEEQEIALLGRPPAREVGAVIMLALRLHLAAPATAGADVAGLRWGEAVRRFALVGLAGAAATNCLAVLAALFSRVPADLADQVSRAEVLLAAVPGFFWVSAYVYLVFGRVRSAALCAVLSCLPALTSLGFWLLPGSGASPLDVLGAISSVLLVLLPVLALVAWRAEAPPTDPRWLLVPLAVAILLVAAAMPVLLTPSLGQRAGGVALLVLGDSAGMTCLSTVVVAAVACWRRDTSWWRTAVVVAVSGALGRVPALLQDLGPQQKEVVHLLGGAQLLAAVGVAVAGVLVLRRDRMIARSVL